ncbi:MAG: phosphoribosyltransferase [Aggregatilineales bacterium]
MQSYDYAKRKGIDEISWERFATLATALTEQLAPHGIDAVIGIARAGLFPATAVACMLRRELYPARITRRLNDQIMYPHPVWKMPISPDVKGKIVAVIDEMADTGETLALVAQTAKEIGAARVITASLVSHNWANPHPDHVALTTDALVIFPWDKQIYADGRWQTHPELEGALKLQKDRRKRWYNVN